MSDILNAIADDDLIVWSGARFESHASQEQAFLRQCYAAGKSYEAAIAQAATNFMEVRLALGARGAEMTKVTDELTVGAAVTCS